MRSVLDLLRPRYEGTAMFAQIAAMEERDARRAELAAQVTAAERDLEQLIPLADARDDAHRKVAEARAALADAVARAQDAERVLHGREHSIRHVAETARRDLERTAPDALIALIDDLERLDEQTRGSIVDPEGWRAQQRRLDAIRQARAAARELYYLPNPLPRILELRQAVFA